MTTIPVVPDISAGARPAVQPVKLAAPAILGLLQRAPFGRLTTYGPADGGQTYVVPLQFVYREGRLYIVTRPGRKVANLHATPGGVCMQVDEATTAGWLSICAWGNYREVQDGGERMRALLASFTKYPARTVQQGLQMLRPTAGPAGAAATRGDFVVGALELTSVAGRQWPGLLPPAGSPLLRPGHKAAGGARGKPLDLTIAQCRAVLDARPLARLGCYHAARGRGYCVPLWYVRESDSLWAYHPQPAGALVAALLAHPAGVCAQVDSLDCRPDSDPAQPWASVVAEGRAHVLPAADHPAVLAALRARLATWGVTAPFAPPDPASGVLVRLDVRALTGVATD